MSEILKMLKESVGLYLSSGSILTNMSKGRVELKAFGVGKKCSYSRM